MDTIKKIISAITEKNDISNVYFVGCGASRSDLYPAYYFLSREATKLKASLFPAKELVLATPVDLGPNSVVISCSLAGTTPEAVEAAKVATERGAHVIALTNKADSPLAANAKYPVIFTWGDTYSSKMDKVIKAIFIACELLNTVEGYAHYDDMLKAVESAYSIIDERVNLFAKDADRFAQKYCDTPLLFVTSSGPMEQIAWSFSMCLMMEMQWIPSTTFNDGDFFHGPFELVDEKADYLVLKNTGRTRPMDDRTIAFLERFHANYTVVDVKDIICGDSIPASVEEYFNPVFISPVLRTYAEHISAVRNHPLTERRYMWKMEY